MYKVVDLFAGAGGLSLGFMQTQKYDIKVAFENSPYMQDTYRLNHPGVEVRGDVCTADYDAIKKKYGEIDVVIGGPPCQGFSNANRQKNHAISQNNMLVKQYIRAILELKPKAFVMENVSMLKSDVHRFYMEESDIETVKRCGIPVKSTPLHLLDAEYMFDGALEIVKDQQIAAGCVVDFQFNGYSDSDYYYISGTRTPDLCISSGGGTTQQPAKEPAKEPAKQPEKEQPAGKASLSVVNRPSKTTYYIGDKLNTTGLSVRYTDTAGKTQTITSGFTTNADLSSAGSKQVTVTYQGVSTTFNVTVKTPSVTVTQEELSEGLRLYATTDPAGQDVAWSSSNPSVAYFEGKTLHAAGSGTAVISATMTYNGRKYSGSTTVVVGEKQEEKEYHFAISVLGGSEEYACYSVDTNIPVNYA